MTFGICLPALAYLFLALLILTITMNLYMWYIVGVVAWAVIIQLACMYGYSIVSWGLLFVPFIIYAFFQF
jgi:hypothetical protein